MTLYNHTKNELAYGVNSPSFADCGTIQPGGTHSDDAWDNREDVTVAFFSLEKDPANTFTITLPDTQTGKVVTIAVTEKNLST